MKIRTRKIVYVDPIFKMASRDSQAFFVGTRTGHKWCHLFSLHLDALHAMAKKIGLKRSWFQNHSTIPHYDLTPNKRKLALRYGAKERFLLHFVRKNLSKLRAMRGMP